MRFRQNLRVTFVWESLFPIRTLLLNRATADVRHSVPSWLDREDFQFSIQFYTFEATDRYSAPLLWSRNARSIVVEESENIKRPAVRSIKVPPFLVAPWTAALLYSMWSPQREHRSTDHGFSNERKPYTWPMISSFKSNPEKIKECSKSTIAPVGTERPKAPHLSSMSANLMPLAPNSPTFTFQDWGLWWNHQRRNWGRVYGINRMHSKGAQPISSPQKNLVPFWEHLFSAFGRGASEIRQALRSQTIAPL